MESYLDYDGVRATSEWRVLNNYWFIWPCMSIGRIGNIQYDTRVIYNSNGRRIMMDGVLMGFDGFRASSGMILLNNYCPYDHANQLEWSGRLTRRHLSSTIQTKWTKGRYLLKIPLYEWKVGRNTIYTQRYWCVLIWRGNL